MMNKLARLSRRLAASLKVPAPELFGKFPVLRVLGSQASASREDSTLLRWAALVGLTGAFATGALTITSQADALEQEQQKVKVVILGTGWGATSFLNALKPEKNTKYDVQVVSPRNYFLFSPLLPAAATGTVDTKSIVNPIRGHLDRTCNYFKAEAKQINVKDKTITCCYEKPVWKICDLVQGKDRVFTLSYDVLIVAVGAVTNTFNVPGVTDHCFFLKSAEDAKAIRERVNACFELANLPDTSSEDRKRLLSFVIAGGGPTGTELAAELNDLIHEDMVRYFPRVQPSDISIRQIDSHDHILSAFDRSIAAYATDHFRRSGIDLILNCRIKAVEENRVLVLDQGSEELRQVPFGTCIWTTGIRMHPLSEGLAEQLQAQEHWRSLKVDRHLMVKGTTDIFALGDAATIDQEKVFSHAEELFEEGDTNHDGKLSSDELQELLMKERKRYPQLVEIAARVPPDSLLTREDFQSHLAELDKSLRSVPATAQVAHQEGHYLGKLFRKHHVDGSGLPEDAPEFQYNNKGSLAYIGGDKAVLDPGEALSFLKYVKGWFMGFGWKSAEIAMQASFKNQLSVMYDFVKTKLFGRDISDI